MQAQLQSHRHAAHRCTRSRPRTRTHKRAFEFVSYAKLESHCGRGRSRGLPLGGAGADAVRGAPAAVGAGVALPPWVRARVGVVVEDAGALVVDLPVPSHGGLVVEEVDPSVVIADAGGCEDPAPHLGVVGPVCHCGSQPRQVCLRGK